MALLDSEVARIKAELGYNLLTTGAVPYIGVTQVFEQVIQENVLAGATTTSSTSVTAASSPTPVTLTLASVTGFTAGDRAVVDVDTRQELATVQAVGVSSITLLLSKAHTGTYPVTVEGGESLVRECLRRIIDVKTSLGSSQGEGALKKVDEIEFYQTGSSLFGTLGNQLMFWRNELAAALGVPNLWDNRSCQVAVY
ncbi:MAG TPA: hypothetical protein VGK73_11345 [Polyangiaceae bacterium]